MKYGLVGENVSSSFSKPIHQSISSAPYELWSMNEDNFINLLKNKQFLGINVTMPYKQVALPYVQELEENVKKIGSLNTIINDHGILKGYNTDYTGFLFLLKFYDIDVTNKKIAILGSGGSSKTIQFALEQLHCSSCLVVSRFKEAPYISYEQLHQIKDIDIIINTTPIGMTGHSDKLLVDLDAFQNLSCVIDIVYTPLKTTLLLEAQKRSIKIASGLIMLVAQAVYAQEIFLNKKFDDDFIVNEYQKIYASLVNFVFIGMPGSGKTTISKKLSENYQKKYISIDDEIETHQQESIKNIFMLYGEEYFRKLETETIQKYSTQFNQIISTGGGAVLNETNIDLLKKNGMIIFIDRGIDKIKLNDQRPLAKTYLDLKTLYETRIPLYNRYCDIKIDNNLSINQTLKRIEEDIHEATHFKWSKSK